jgi:predicted secreted hydrolase
VIGSRGLGLLGGVLGAIVCLFAGLGAMIVLDREPASTAPLRARLAVAEALGTSSAEGFARALTPRPFAFPADHGPHPTFRTEWWYWTGNLRTAGVGAGPSGNREGSDVRRFGFQLTFFRTALVPAAVPRRSAWGARDVYMAHLALTDVDGGRFHARDRWARAALDLAGATAEPLRVWLGDWTAEGRGPDGLPVRLRAGEGDLGIDLTLSSAKPAVLHGERGLSRKSDEPGNASYYYSLTRMPASGVVRVDGRAYPVEGAAWMDREWSTSALGPDLVGWDWFALQLDDGRELMLYRLRRGDGSIDPASQGTLVAPDGASRGLARDAVEVLTLAHWTSPRGGIRYPARWRIRVPSAGLDVVVTPLVAEQELDLAVRYWEGTVGVEGTVDGRRLGGTGYVELVGYDTAARRPGGAVRQ